MKRWQVLFSAAGAVMALMLLAGSLTAAVAKPAGKLTIGLSSLGTEEIWLPWAESGREGWSVVGAVYESLLTTDRETGGVLPMVAERWQVEKGGKQWRFFLRRGIQFHAGHGELTADYVKFSMEMYVDKKARGSAAAAYRRR